MSARPCGCATDAPDHLAPDLDWIGDSPIVHGERDEPTPAGALSAPCLCGHPEYLTCPETWGGGVNDLTLTGTPYGGAS